MGVKGCRALASRVKVQGLGDAVLAVYGQKGFSVCRVPHGAPHAFTWCSGVSPYIVLRLRCSSVDAQHASFTRTWRPQAPSPQPSNPEALKPRDPKP